MKVIIIILNLIFYVAIDVYARAGIYRAFRYKIFLNESVMACFIDLSRNVIDFLV